MPLVATVMAQGLAGIGAPSDKASTAQAWGSAWFDYFSQCVQLSPAALTMKQVTVAAFQGPMMAGLDPNNATPDAFILALQMAMIAGMTALAAAVLPPVTAIVPPVGPLSATLTAPSTSTDLTSACQQMATGIHAWTITGTATTPSGPINLS